MTGHIQESLADPALSKVPILRKPVPVQDLVQVLGVGSDLQDA
jgi:hypothetical protein